MAIRRVIPFPRRVACAAAAVLACGGIAGCGITGAAGPPVVSVAMVAPSPGATVNVRSIEVLGKVEPQTAKVAVDGHRVRVAAGVFSQPMVLHHRLTKIRIQASAKGFASSSAVVSVAYARAAAPTTVGPTGGATAGVPAVPAVPVSPQSTLEQEASSSCAASGGNVGLCTCVFSQLSAAGFNTEAHWEALIENWRQSLLANGSITYPPVVLNAIKTCAASAGQ